MYAPNTQLMTMAAAPEAPSPSQIVMMAPAQVPAQHIAPIIPQQPKDNRKSANNVAGIEIAYRCFLLLRTIFLVMSVSGTSPRENWFNLHEAFRLWPGLLLWGTLDGDNFNIRRNLSAFLIPYLLYSAFLLVLTGQLYSATSPQDATLDGQTLLSRARLWVQTYTFLLIVEVFADFIGFFFFMMWIGSRSGDELLLLVLFSSIVSIIYQGYCLSAVKAYKLELEQKYGYGFGYDYGLLGMNPAIGFNQLSVVQPQAYQASWNPNLPQQGQQQPQLQYQMGMAYMIPQQQEQGQQQYQMMMIQVPQQIAVDQDAFW